MYKNNRTANELALPDAALHQPSSRRDGFRLNPSDATVRYSTELRGSAFVGKTDVQIGQSVEVEGILRCGVKTRIACERESFRGVAAKLSIDENDEIVAELILLNKDPSLDLPLACSDDMNDLAADWQMWAKRYNLPLVLIEADGVEQMISTRIGALDVNHPTPRRAPSHFRARRPRFLARRKTGQIDNQNKTDGRELIARN